MGVDQGGLKHRKSGLRPFLEKQISGRGLPANVFLLGERDDIADLLSIFDVYAMSSRWEGVGRALTEAMHMGLPVVATSVDGVTELICDEETGLLVAPENPHALAGAIDRLVSDRYLAVRLGANGRRRVMELMDGERMVLAIEELYQQLSEPAPAPSALSIRATCNPSIYGGRDQWQA